MFASPSSWFGCNLTGCNFFFTLQLADGYFFSGKGGKGSSKGSKGGFGKSGKGCTYNHFWAINGGSSGKSGKSGGGSKASSSGYAIQGDEIAASYPTFYPTATTYNPTFYPTAESSTGTPTYQPSAAAFSESLTTTPPTTSKASKDLTSVPTGQPITAVPVAATAVTEDIEDSFGR